jgi:hypothetical protein
MSHLDDIEVLDPAREFPINVFFIPSPETGQIQNQNNSELYFLETESPSICNNLNNPHWNKSTVINTNRTQQNQERQSQ